MLAIIDGMHTWQLEEKIRSRDGGYLTHAPETLYKLMLMWLEREGIFVQAQKWEHCFYEMDTKLHNLQGSRLLRRGAGASGAQGISVENFELVSYNLIMPF